MAGTAPVLGVVQAQGNTQLQGTGTPPVSILPISTNNAPQTAPQTTPGGTTTGGTTTGGTTTTGPSAATLTALNQELANVNQVATGSLPAAESALVNGPNGITSIANNLQAGQNNVDYENTQANLAKNQGMMGVNRMINEGVQSGGITLANDNASNSSAADALARAYGIEGRDAASQVGNQFATSEAGVAKDQQAQNLQESSGLLNLQDAKTQAINTIWQDAVSRLSALATSAVYANAPQLANIQAQEAAIKSQATSALSQYDAQIAAAVQPTALTSGQVAQNAQNLAVAGTAATTPYSYTNVAPPTAANAPSTGPSPAPLPIYLAPPGSKQASTLPA